MDAGQETEDTDGGEPCQPLPKSRVFIQQRQSGGSDPEAKTGGKKKKKKNKSCYSTIAPQYIDVYCNSGAPISTKVSFPFVTPVLPSATRLSLSLSSASLRFYFLRHQSRCRRTVVCENNATTATPPPPPFPVVVVVQQIVTNRISISH